MRPRNLPGMARDLPSGMIACRIDGVEARVAAISPGAVDLRAAEKLRCARALELSFYRPESGDYLQIPAENVQAGRRARGWRDADPPFLCGRKAPPPPSAAR